MSVLALSPNIWNHRKYISYCIHVTSIIYIDTRDTKGRKGLSIIIYKQTENNADI